MSTLKTNNVQVGQSVTATNNFTIYQPSSPDGTVRIGVGNSGATTADVLTANSSGNVGIGTSSPDSLSNFRFLDVGSSGTNQGVVQANNGTVKVAIYANSTEGYLATRTNHNLNLQTNGSTRATIDSSGNLCVGRGSVGAGDRFIVQTIASGTIMLGYNSSATNTYQVLDSGNVRNTNNSYGAISDQRRKENIVDATPKLEKLNQVRIVNFNIIDDEQKQIGVVAQELEQIFPSMVEEDSDGMKAVKYSVFVPILIKSIQEQQAMIEELKAKVTALEGAKG